MIWLLLHAGTAISAGIPSSQCLRNGRDWLDLTEHDGPVLGHSGQHP